MLLATAGMLLAWLGSPIERRGVADTPAQIRRLAATIGRQSQRSLHARTPVVPCAVIDCDCPGCRAYLDACDIPYSRGETEFPASPSPAESGGRYQATPGADGATSGDAETPSGTTGADAGPLPSMTGLSGATAVAVSSAPNQIGDLFGVSSGSSLVLLDRLFVIGSDIDATVQTPPDSPFTASESPSTVAVAEGYTLVERVIVPDNVVNNISSPAEFTTAIATSEVQAELTTDPNTNIPIVNNSAYEGFAESELIARHGEAGATEYNSGESFAHMQDAVLPPGGPGAGEDYDAVYAYDYVVEVPIDALGGAPGANVGRQKMSENSSPIPRDRLIDSFSYFHNTPLLSRGKSVT
ncbi:MAG: hypothetical protein AAF961_13465, partial [Planctomycetota bacterium]